MDVLDLLFLLPIGVLVFFGARHWSKRRPKRSGQLPPARNPNPTARSANDGDSDGGPGEERPPK